ncbi:MAG: acyltransferase [Candidatus Omnitrophica bacterium]|nr:acyltransferase [Candidatus Omnitrophota bacterium]
MIKSFIRMLFCICYYGFARWLPPSFVPGGEIPKALRYWICRPLFASCGRNVNIETGAFFHSGSGIRIGDHSGIGLNAYLSGRITIGNNVMMGKDVIIRTQSHNFSRTDIPMNQQGFQSEAPVTIHDDVWIGDRVIILPGITVGEGAIIGAGAIVTRNVPEYMIVGGNPAKIIKSRKEGSSEKDLSEKL